MGRLEKVGEHVDWFCVLKDITDYLNKRRKEITVIFRILSPDVRPSVGMAFLFPLHRTFV